MSVLDKMFEVFDAVGTWIGDAVQAMIPIFWDSTNGLTFLGTLAVLGVAFAVMFLIIGIIQKFLHIAG